MATSASITRRINQIADNATRRAVQAVFDQVQADAAANKTVFDAHTHRCNGGEAGSYTCTGPGSDTADVTADQTATTFSNNL